MEKDLKNMILNQFTFEKAEKIIFFCEENKVFEFIADILEEENLVSEAQRNERRRRTKKKYCFLI